RCRWLVEYRGRLGDVATLEHRRPEPTAVAVEGEQRVARANDDLAWVGWKTGKHKRRGRRGTEPDLPEVRAHGANRVQDPVARAEDHLPRRIRLRIEAADHGRGCPDRTRAVVDDDCASCGI